jgi:hypothetical protein
MTSLNDLSQEPLIGPKLSATEQYKRYLESLGKLYTHTGFLEFSPRDQETQSKYDAMQPTWEGVESSDKAIAKGLYVLDHASDDRGSKSTVQVTPPIPKTEPAPKESSSFCVVS